MWPPVVGDCIFLSKKFVNIYFLLNYCANFIIAVYFYTISSVIPVNNEAAIISGHHPLRIFATPDNKNVDRYPEPDVQQP